MKKILLITILALNSSAFAGYFPPASTQKLIEKFEILNDKCRGGSGDDDKTFKFCNQRDVLYPKIKKQGWCWGAFNIDAPEASKQWLPCEMVNKDEP